ncbi:CCA tRNA nucleotidyltransferase [Sphingomonas sp. G-3-2-10]|uniref:CCA tRNA nucleotidyltransferase n=1 Tax=Sphingomonas sp. G-3-2-10 TaxID=2728838 RepID=UPI00146B9545|nr:CCA tRNA nucleotidyltransferase [Sphingomonas sp. G-3-2-10]NML04929.1 CCA tRNA nucleotidyltransferase [Sphingomonas sp. G-3-2-10]
MDRMILPHADWRDRVGLAGLARVLTPARFVGGAVRDTLLGIPVADIDIATPHPPEAVIDMLKESGIRVVPTGLQHGTVTAVLESGPVEVTTLRRDVSTDGRHATVAFTDDWREDAARRDFTMNALYADPVTGEIFDYFEGLADLEARKVRFIGDPLQRIAEDHLRILRFFRFLARFGDAPDAEGLEACVTRAKDLMALSRERIADELLKLLVAKDAVGVMRLMVDRGILLPVIPEITAEGVERLAALAPREAEAGVAPNAMRRLMALLPADPAVAETVGARLRLSKAQRKRLAIAAAAPDSEPKALAYRSGVEGAVDRLLLSDRPVSETVSIRDWEPPRFPLSGGAIVARGVKAGPDVARLMRRVEDQWAAEGFPDAARVEAIADVMVGQSL